MSVHYLSKCWAITGISQTQKLVLISLADQANDSGVCWPSIANMMTRTCLSERSVRNALRGLEQRGLLFSSQRAGRSTWYDLTPALNAPRQEVPPTPAGDAPPPRQEVPPTPAGGAPPPRQEVPPTPAGDAPRTVIEPSIEPSENRQCIAQPDKPASQTVIHLPTNRHGVLFSVSEDDYRLWSETYPAVNIKQELLKILAWLDANKSKRKTIAGMKRFINNWLSRAQDTGGSRHAASGRNNQENYINWDSTDWADGIVGDGQGADQQAVRNAENDFPCLAASFQDAKGS